MRIIAGEARSRTIVAPPGRDTRPTLDRVRENLFNILQNRVRGARTLDLFAGSGALSLEAVSRGAADAVLADHDRAAIEAEKRNIAALGFEGRTRVIQADWQAAVRTLEAEGALFDLIFLDPPYAMRDLTDVTLRLTPLLAQGAMIVIEHEARVEPVVADAYEQTDHRKYGYAGVSFFRARV